MQRLLTRVFHGEAGERVAADVGLWLYRAGLRTDERREPVACHLGVAALSDLDSYGVVVLRRSLYRPSLSLRELDDAPFLTDVASSPAPQTAWIELVFVDVDDAPAGHVEFTLRLPDGCTRSSRANALGVAYYTDLEDGDCELTLSALDTARWELEGAPNDGPQTDGATFAAHTIVQGECIELLAARLGHCPAVIWDASGNKALREQRPSLAVLAPGDSVYIPPIRGRTEFIATGASHRIVVQRPCARFITQFLIDDEPRANEDYTLSYRGCEVTGQTDSEGVIDEPIPFDLNHLTVRFATTGESPERWCPESIDDADDPEFEHEGELMRSPASTEAFDRYVFDLRDLDPSAELTGAQGRLYALGFDIGRIDGVRGPRTVDALRSFQRNKGLDITTELDASTIDALSSVIIG